MTFIQKQALWVSRDADGNIVLHFPTTHVAYVEGGVATVNGATPDENKNVTIPVGVKTVNGIEPDANGDVVVAGLPIGHEWWTMNPNIPVGCLPLFGGTYSREAYKDLWAWVQTQGTYLITEAEWQEKATANEGNVAFYSDGDGSTTFRVPSLKCHVQGANGVEEVGSYLKAGLPNITGGFSAVVHDHHGNTATGAFGNTVINAYVGRKDSALISTGEQEVYGYDFNASRLSSVYGNSDTVQPPSIVGMYLVKAFGTVSNVGNQDIADISAGLTRLENDLSTLENDLSTAVVGASISGKVITLTFADGTTKTLTTQDTNTDNINTYKSTNINSYSGTGYVVFNNKQCIQWGATTTASDYHAITFPKAFAYLHAVVITEHSDRGRTFSVGERTKTGFKAYLDANDNCSWIAIGVVS